MSRFVFCTLLLIGGALSAQTLPAFQLKLPYEKTTLIPTKAMMCKHQAYGLTNEQRIASSYFDINFPQFIWTGSEKSQVSIDEIRVTLQDQAINNGKAYECKLLASEIKFLYYKAGPDRNGQIQVQTWPTMITQNQGSEYWRNERKMTACPIRCGGITVARGTGSLSVKARVHVKATEKITNPDGSVTETPHSTEQAVTIKQKGNWF